MSRDADPRADRIAQLEDILLRNSASQTERSDNVAPLWLAKCQADSKGKPIPNLHNAGLALAEDPQFAGAISFDEMQRSPMLHGHKIEDAELVSLHDALQVLGLRRLSLDTVHEAVRLVAYKKPVHPLRKWLTELQWDGILRLANWLPTYLGVPSSEYARAVGSMFLTAMVARIFKPGCQCDYMLVLEGPQGILKSQACRVLGGEYYSDTLPDLAADQVRVSMHLRGKWLIEASELSAMMSKRVEAARLKSFLTTQVEQFTAKHARAETTEPRQCVFVGTTNEDMWQRDDTGGRRFWPITCGSINILALKQDREQLFAEAVNAYQHGAQWWPDPAFERLVIAPQQDQRLWHDAWEEPIQNWLSENLKTRSTLADIAYAALGFTHARFSQVDQKRLANVLKHLGWEQRRSKTERWWAPASGDSGDAG